MHKTKKKNKLNESKFYTWFEASAVCCDNCCLICPGFIRCWEYARLPFALICGLKLSAPIIPIACIPCKGCPGEFPGWNWDPCTSPVFCLGCTKHGTCQKRNPHNGHSGNKSSHYSNLGLHSNLRKKPPTFLCTPLAQFTSKGEKLFCKSNQGGIFCLPKFLNTTFWLPMSSYKKMKPLLNLLPENSLKAQQNSSNFSTLRCGFQIHLCHLKLKINNINSYSFFV